MNKKRVFLNFKLKSEKPRICPVRSSEGCLARANVTTIHYFYRLLVVGSNNQVCARPNSLLFSTWLERTF
ncbi:hypothetical protein CsSME_00024656 [Camellia sinensis var. sinensis]